MSQPSLRHLAIILDGNRRWASAQGLPALEGHRRGYDAVKRLADWCLARQLAVVTVWAFSTENWQRTQEEVGYLMDLLEMALTNDVDEYHKKGIRIRVLGRREGLRPSIVKGIARAEEMTKNNTQMTLVIGLNYGGRPEIVDAVKALLAAGVRSDEVTEEKLTSYMYWPDMPEPDFIIRTSGERRLSGFLLWEAPYAELYWSQKHWPEFTELDLDAALADYANRQRRFGK